MTATRPRTPAQTALVRTYAAWRRVRKDNPYGYARAVLVNHVTDGWRRPIREHVTDELPERRVPGDMADAVTQRQWLIQALGALTRRERAVIVLRYFFDLPENSVAGELNISVGTVKSAHARAMAKLRISTEASGGPTSSSKELTANRRA